MLTDKEAEEIRRGLAVGMRGPVLIKWCEQLLADRDERRAQERVQGQRPWPGPVAGPKPYQGLTAWSLARDLSLLVARRVANK
jgi:hypothetical protein